MAMSTDYYGHAPAIGHVGWVKLSIFYLWDTKKTFKNFEKQKKCCLSKKPKPKLDKDKIWGKTSAVR